LNGNRPIRAKCHEKKKHAIHPEDEVSMNEAALSTTTLDGGGFLTKHEYEILQGPIIFPRSTLLLLLVSID
jgi:hypothetical protein